MISYYSVTKKFNKEVALRDVSFTIEKGEFVFLTGVSGSGKSTLLRMLCREVKPTEGSIYVFDRRINRMNPKKLRRRMGIVFQDYRLLPNKTVLENVSYPLACLGMNPFKVKKKALEALKKMQMEEFKNKMPDELSGGQQQRVAIARAIVTDPELLICDEPTGNLDMEHTWIIMKYLEQLNESGTTIIMTTHNEEVVKKSNKRVIRLHLGEIIEDTANEMDIYGEPEEEVYSLEDNTTPSLWLEDNLVENEIVEESYDFYLGDSEASRIDKEKSILKKLGWTDEDERKFQERYQMRKMEGR